MVQVAFGHGFMPCQIDDFPERCDRSRTGSIHIRPDSLEEMTVGELNHIRRHYPQLLNHILTIRMAEAPLVEEMVPTVEVTVPASESASEVETAEVVVLESSNMGIPDTNSRRRRR